ncbi:MAG: DUF2948 family protein [Alphaproteobacteria bacterium]|nr:DUF2948 family protein [Alphaproteobacteria bacterium]
MSDPGSLHLLAHDAEDLAIVSAMLQDAVTRLGDLVYLPRRRLFAAVVSRYRWEAIQSGRERVRTGIHFRGVRRTQVRGLDPAIPDTVAELLALRGDLDAEGAGAITLEFSGGGSVRLSVECVDVEMQDLTAPWAAKRRPEHVFDVE